MDRLNADRDGAERRDQGPRGDAARALNASLSWRLPALSLVVFGILAGVIAPWMGWAFGDADLSARAEAAGLTPRVWTSIQLYLVLCASAVLPAALLASPLRRGGADWVRALGMAKPDGGGSRLGAWLMGVAGGLTLIFALMLLLWIGGWMERATASPSLGIVLLVSTALVFAALYEELLFRGFGFWAMERLAGPVVAITATSVLFAWAHSNNAGANLIGLLNTALAGALLGWMRWRTGHIWSAWGLHFGWNLCLGVLSGATTSGFGFAGRLARTDLTEKGRSEALVSGAAYGPEASLVLTALLGLWLVAVIYRARSTSVARSPAPS